SFVRDLSTRGRLVLTGPDRVRFLQGMVTNEVASLTPGQGCLAAMLTVKGKLLGDLVTYADDDAFFLECESNVRHTLHDVLQKHMMMDDVELTDQTDTSRELGFYGDDAQADIEKTLQVQVPSLAPYAHAFINDVVRVAATPEL